MTPPPTQARTANEQRIASLEAEVVTMREAMEAVVKDADERIAAYPERESQPNRVLVMDQARAALSSSTDYANKVVVDREEWEATATICAIVQPDHGSDCECQVCVAFARLDALRKGGEG